MKDRTRWDYYQVQQMVRRRLEREWEPPAAPCVTPIIGLLEKQNGSLSTYSEKSSISDVPKKSKGTQQLKLCYTHICQLPDMKLPETVSQTKIRFCPKWNKISGNSRKKTMLVPFVGQMNLPESQGVSVIFLHYDGPEHCHRRIPAVFQEASNLKEHTRIGINPNLIHVFGKSTFHIELPELTLKVGTLASEQYLQHHMKKKRDLFAVWKP